MAVSIEVSESVSFVLGKKTENIKSSSNMASLSLHHIYNKSFPSPPSAGSVLPYDAVRESGAPSGSPPHLRSRKKRFFFVCSCFFEKKNPALIHSF